LASPHSTAEAEPEAVILDLGLRPYEDVLEQQRRLVSARQADQVPDTLVLVEHPEVITLGRSAKPENVLDAEGIPVIAIERGGDVTLHGPGQLVAYPIFRLREGERDLARYLRGLESAIMLTLADFTVSGLRVPGKTGVWTGPPEQPRKLASIGIAVRKWVTMHGLALNVSIDLDRFAAIHPCGFPASVMTSMARELGRPVDFAAVKRSLRAHLGTALGRRWRQTGE
jgi:lipoyl(octanoyl) transferase